MKAAAPEHPKTPKVSTSTGSARRDTGGRVKCAFAPASQPAYHLPEELIAQRLLILLENIHSWCVRHNPAGLGAIVFNPGAIISGFTERFVRKTHSLRSSCPSLHEKLQSGRRWSGIRVSVETPRNQPTQSLAGRSRKKEPYP